MISIRQGEALDVLRTLDDASCHALVTDPPAGIAFMGKGWDRDRGGRAQWVAWLAEILTECRRVLKPGAHALVWALPKTQHWTATAVEDAGFEIVDVIVHLYGQGYPKSANVSKLLDKHLGVERPVLGPHPAPCSNLEGTVAHGGGYHTTPMLTGPGSDEAKRWQGWGTGLKPAAEHWILARVPLDGTIPENVLEHEAGGLNIDACRVPCEGGSPSIARRAGSPPAHYQGDERRERESRGKFTSGTSSEVYATPRPGETLGRWPANLVLDEDAAAELDAQTLAGGMHSAGSARVSKERTRKRCNGTSYDTGLSGDGGHRFGDSGGASRFFYTAKASKREKGEGNTYPTPKPIALMRWLIRLVTPPGGTVLDPFAGSGTTVLAALAETCFNCIAIEREGDYASIALTRAQGVDPLFHNVPAIARREEWAAAQRRRTARAELHERTGLELEDVSRAAYW